MLSARCKNFYLFINHQSGLQEVLINYYKFLVFKGIEVGQKDDHTILRYAGLSVIVIDGETPEDAKDNLYEITSDWGCLDAYIASEPLPSSKEEYDYYDLMNEEEEINFTIKTEQEAKAKGVFQDLNEVFPPDEWIIEKYSEKYRYSAF